MKRAILAAAVTAVECTAAITQPGGTGGRSQGVQQGGQPRHQKADLIVAGAYGYSRPSGMAFWRCHSRSFPLEPGVLLAVTLTKLQGSGDANFHIVQAAIRQPFTGA